MSTAILSASYRKAAELLRVISYWQSISIYFIITTNEYNNKGIYVHEITLEMLTGQVL